MHRKALGLTQTDLAEAVVGRPGIDAGALNDCLAIGVPDRACDQVQMDAMARWLLQHFLGRCWLGVEQLSRLAREPELRAQLSASALTANV